MGYFCKYYCCCIVNIWYAIFLYIYSCKNSDINKYGVPKRRDDFTVSKLVTLSYAVFEGFGYPLNNRRFIYCQGYLYRTQTVADNLIEIYKRWFLWWDYLFFCIYSMHVKILNILTFSRYSDIMFVDSNSIERMIRKWRCKIYLTLKTSQNISSQKQVVYRRLLL